MTSQRRWRLQFIQVWYIYDKWFHKNYQYQVPFRWHEWKNNLFLQKYMYIKIVLFYCILTRCGLLLTIDFIHKVQQFSDWSIKYKVFQKLFLLLFLEILLFSILSCTRRRFISDKIVNFVIFYRSNTHGFIIHVLRDRE